MADLTVNRRRHEVDAEDDTRGCRAGHQSRLRGQSDRGRRGTGRDTWETYPILRFSEVPAIDVEFVAWQGNPPLGIGECAQGPTPAAIADAVYGAIGVRVRSLPLTPEQLIAAIPD